MALVIFFVTDPAKAVTEMVRVVCPGGTVAAYVWDFLAGGFPLEPFEWKCARWVYAPDCAEPGRVSNGSLQDLWTGAGLEAVETKVITVQRTFDDFEDLWTTTLGSSVSQAVAALASSDVELLKARMRHACPRMLLGASPMVHTPTR